ncbi:MAG: SH3 domain-containing protein [Roseburia sp.]|nr:SH3 domain-containing protein [Roseburia sp.]
MKKNIDILIDKLLKNSKIVFPVIAGVAVAITVAVAMSAFGARADKMEQLEREISAAPEDLSQPEPESVEPEDVPLKANEDAAIEQLITRYFEALAAGDKETLNTICDFIEEDKLLEITELAKYIETYDELEIYTKPGYSEGAYVAYVCYRMLFSGKDSGYPGYRTLYISKNTQGELYLKFDLSAEENEYIVQVSSQADVVDMNNRVTVKYNDLMSEKPELLRYLSEVHNEVQVAMGVIYGQEVTGGDGGSDGEGGASGEDPEGTDGGSDAEEGSSEPEAGAEPENTVLYAKANTTVNVRNSDSQQADKLGKVSSGTKLQVLEQRVNGWTKVIFENQEGYIKSEFLDVLESAEGAEVIGSVTAESNVNVRAAASETADRLGVLTGGDSAELLAKENGWCKILYEGQIGYVKEDFVR